MTSDHADEKARTDAFARPADHYATLDDPESQTSPEVIRAALREFVASAAVGGPVLDLGTGVGGNLPLIGARFAAFGSEIAASAARRAAAHAPVVVADGARLPFADGSFGAVVCTEVLEHVADASTIFGEMARALRADGLAFVTTPNYANVAGLHKLIADRRSGRHDWNPWGAHHGGFEAFMTGRKLWRAARPWFALERVRGLDYGQALTGRFRMLDKAAWTGPGKAMLRRILPALHAARGSVIPWHGMHVELILRRRAAPVH